jgi:hypothetical protein
MANKKLKLVVDSSVATESDTTIQLVAKNAAGEIVGQNEYKVTTRPADNEKYQKWVVFAVAGQSNSVGYDESENTIETNPNSDPDRIKQLGLFGDNNLKIIPLQSMAENVQNMTGFGISAGKKGTKGLHLPLAELIAKHIPDDYGVIVVPVAYGMTHFTKSYAALTYNTGTLKPDQADAANGTWRAGFPYHQMLRDRVKYCLDLGLGKEYNKFAGVIWCQGEADTANHGGNSSTHIDYFKELIETLAEDWKDYEKCSPTGKMDKSVWFVHDTTRYWRKRSSNAEGVDVSTIWLNYMSYLGNDHVVNILPLDDYTNAVNGGGTRTSSTYNSHYGNNAYRDVVAPRVLDCLLKHQMIYGQDPKARNTTTFHKITEVWGARSQGVDIKENGDTIWAVAEYVNFTINNGGAPSLIFDEDITEVQLTNVNPGSMFIYQFDEKTKAYKGFIFGLAGGFNQATTDRFWGLKSDVENGKDIIKFGFHSDMDKKTFTFPKTINKPTRDDVYTLILGGGNGICVKLNGETLIDTKDTLITNTARPRLGLTFGWMLNEWNQSNQAACKILYAKRGNGEVIRPAYYFEPQKVNFTDTTPITVEVTTSGEVGNLAVVEGDAAVNTIRVAQNALNKKEITITPLDSGSSTVTFDVVQNGETYNCECPVTIADSVFYHYFKMSGKGYGSTYLVATGAGDKKTYFNLDTDLDLSLITIKDQATAVDPYVTFDFANKCFTYKSSTSGNAALEVTLQYNGEDMGVATICFSQSGSGNNSTDINYKVKK